MTTWMTVQVKAEEVCTRSDTAGLKGRVGLEKYLVDAKGLVFWGEENFLKLDNGDVCTTL